MKILIANHRAPSWNSFYAGKHWAKRKALADEIHMLVRVGIDPDWEIDEGNRVAITVIATYKHHPVDSCNIMAKVYIDGLIGWCIADDDMKNVASTTTIPRLGEEDSVEIIVEAYDENSF